MRIIQLLAVLLNDGCTVTVLRSAMVTAAAAANKDGTTSTDPHMGDVECQMALAIAGDLKDGRSASEISSRSMVYLDKAAGEKMPTEVAA